MTRLACLWLSLVPFSLLGGFATPPVLQDPAPATKDGFVIEPGDHSVPDLIDRAAKFLGRNYLLAPGEVAGRGGDPTVHIQTKLALDARGCEQVLSQLAYSVGLVMTPVDTTRGIWEWINLYGGRRADAFTRALFMTPEEVQRNSTWKVVVSTQIIVKHVNAAAATNSLRPFFGNQMGGNAAPGAQFGQVGNAPAILITGFADQVTAALRMVEQADEAAAGTVPAQAQAEWQSAIEGRVAGLEKLVRELTKK